MGHSAIYEGRVEHRRFVPVPHAFHYSMAQLYLDLDELPEVLDFGRLASARRAALLRFHDADYLPERATSLKRRAQEIVARETGMQLDGAVRLLTHVRTLGHVFNPVSFYYCHDRDDRLRAVVSEITNTPWKERHCYVVPHDDASGTLQSDFDKVFHVSPFMDMQQRYHWHFGVPGERLQVHMRNTTPEGPSFDATLDLERRVLDAPGLRRILVRYPLMTLQVVTAIHWQALRLWWKKVPFHSHPSKRSPTGEVEIPR